MSERSYLQHGRRHGPDGSDPIPALASLLIGSLSLLYSNTFASDAATLDTGASSISTESSHLLIFGTARSATAAVTDVMRWQFGGDTGSHYNTFTLTGNGSTANSGTTTQSTSCRPVIIPADSATGYPTDSFGSYVMFIPFYTSTSAKTILTLAGTSAGLTVEASQCIWNNTAAIDQIVFSNLSNANFRAGTSIVVYGFG